MIDKTPDFNKLRNDFPMLLRKMHGKPLIYLDSAATAQKPQVMIDTIADFYQNHYATVHRAVYELAAYSSQGYQLARKKVKDFIHAASAVEIIFTRGTTESINLVAYSFGKAFVKPGDEILISAMEHHSNIVPWQILCEDRGALLKVAPMNAQGEIIIEEFKRMLSPRTRLVALTHVSNSLGTINPIKELTALAHECGAKVLVDGAQSAPHMPIDVQELGVDFFVFSGHKVYGPTGIGVLYGKEKLLEQMPPYQGGGDMIDTVTFAKTTYNVLPLKFEAGTPLIAEVLGLGAALDYVQKVGLQAISEWEHELLDYATKGLNQIAGLRIIGTAKKKAAIINFVVEGAHSLDIGTLLDLKGIAVRTGHLCTQPVLQFFNVTSSVRASFAFYNTKEEIDIFVKALQDVVMTLRG